MPEWRKLVDSHSNAVVPFLEILWNASFLSLYNIYHDFYDFILVGKGA